MELQVNEIKALEPIKFNYEQLKQELTTKVENYKNIVYTEDSIKEAKTDRANLNKLSKALNDEKIKVKNRVLEPYLPFEKQCNELIELVKEASNHADTQIKTYEQQAKDEKLKNIINFFMENVGEYADLINFDNIYNERWLNVTYKMEQIEKDILHIIAKTTTDLKVIDSQFQEESINKQVKMEYFKQIANPSVLTLAILEGNKMVEQNKRLEELKQKEEKSTQNTTISEQNVEKTEQKPVNSIQNVPENEELQILDFRVHVTQRQKFALREFLKANNIEFEPVPYAKVNRNDLIPILEYCHHLLRLVSPADAAKYGLNNFDGAICEFIANLIYNIKNNKQMQLHSIPGEKEESFDIDLFKRIQIDLQGLEEQ